MIRTLGLCLVLSLLGTGCATLLPRCQERLVPVYWDTGTVSFWVVTVCMER